MTTLVMTRRTLAKLGLTITELVRWTFTMLRWTHRHLMPHGALHPRSAMALIKRKGYHDSDNQREIGYASVLMNQQGGQEEIVPEEQDEIDGKQPPDAKHLSPVKTHVLITHHTHQHTQQWGCKEQSPHHQVSDILLF